MKYPLVRFRAVFLVTAVLAAAIAVPGQAATLFYDGLESEASVQAGGGSVYGGSFVPGKVGDAFLSTSYVHPQWGAAVPDYITFPTWGRVDMVTGCADMYVYVLGDTLQQHSQVFLLDLLGSPPWFNRIIISLTRYNPATGQMTLNTHTTSDVFLTGFPVDTNIAGSVDFAANRWHRVTVMWSGLDGVAVPEVKCYFDGIEVASHTGAPGSILMAESPTEFYIGRNHVSSDVAEPRPTVILDEYRVLDQPFAASAAAGVVRSASTGLPIDGAVITLEGGQVAVTGSDGAYSFDILPGDYNIGARASGFIETETLLTVEDGAAVQKDISLQTQPIFDLFADMSTTVNPSGVWTYGFKTSPTAVPITNYTSFSNSIIAGPGALANVKNASFEVPVTSGLTWGPITDWANDDRYGTGAPVGVMLAADQNRLPGGAPEGQQVGAVRECWFNQLLTRPDGSWIGSEPNHSFTLTAYLGIDTISPTQGLRPRTLTFGIYGMGVNDWIAKQDLDLSDLTPGTMQKVTVSFVTTPASGIIEQGMLIGLLQTEPSSLVLIDDVTFEIAPIVSEGIPAWAKLDANNSAVGKNITEAAVGGSGQPWIEPGMAYAFPGEAGQYAVARWTAPLSGSVNIDTLLTGQHPAGTTTDVHVVHNGDLIFSGDINGFYGSSPYYSDRMGSAPYQSFVGGRTVAVGDTIDFCVGYGSGSSANDAAGISALIVPESSQVGVISGVVTAQTPGNPALAGAIVRLADSSRMAVTGADGSYSMLVPAGTCRLNVSKPGFVSQSLSKAVPTSGSAVLNFALMPVYNLGVKAQPIMAGSVTLDGQLTEWSDAEFVALDRIYDVPQDGEIWLDADVPEAYYAARWNADDQKVYVAVKVRDTSHRFSDGYYAFDEQDGVELFIHTTGAGPVDYSADQAAAQHYAIGIVPGVDPGTPGVPVQTWQVIGDGIAIPTAAGFDSAASVNGQWLCYEVAITPFELFSLDGEGIVESPLSAGQIIGLDVVAVGCDSSGYYTGMKAANTAGPKWADYSTFARHLLMGQFSGIDAVTTAADGSEVACSGVVTAAFPDFFYIESTNRVSGVRVSMVDHGLSAGSIATVSGYVHTMQSGERFVLAETARATGTGEVEPLGMTNRALGGAAGSGQPGVQDATGLNNIGLLVKTTGSVTQTSTDSFTIDDGSGVEVKVAGSLPEGAAYVSVTGISSCVNTGAAVVRQVIAIDVQEIPAP